jgi:hypothetical protein
MPNDVTLMSAATRFVVVHYHIFKNAGSTVEHILEREFPGCFARVHGPSPESTLDAEVLSSFLAENPGVRAVTSHHLRYPLPVIRNTVVFDCCFIRHPLDRLDSVYQHLRREDSNDELSWSARRQTPVGFMRLLLDRYPEQVSNVQVTQIGNRGAFMRPASEADLDRAVTSVRNMALPGVVEMFHESMVAGEYYMRPAFPSLRLSAVPVNVGRRMVSNVAEREQRLIHLWGQDLYDYLARVNAMDLELFSQTVKEIRQRLSFVPGVPARMAEFASRCEQRIAAAS